VLKERDGKAKNNDENDNNNNNKIKTCHWPIYCKHLGFKELRFIIIIIIIIVNIKDWTL